MTQTSLATAAELDEVAHRGWPALETQEIGGWIARASGGVTRRANSVLTTGDVPNLDAAIQSAEHFYRDHGLATTFHVSDGSRPGSLSSVLDKRGYRREGETLAQVATLASVKEKLAASVSSGLVDEVQIADEPDGDWLRMWWSVDGRGGPEDLAVAKRIMTSTPALYAAVHDATGVTSGARLALVDDWGALFSLVVRPNARRQGLATHVLAALVGEAEKRGVTRLCLQVLATSHGALAFYESLGFETASNYRYWVLNPSGRLNGQVRTSNSSVQV